MHEKQSAAEQGAPSRQDMATLLSRCGIEFDSQQLDRLWQYHQLLRERNPELNLTRIHNFHNMVIKLYVDSLLPGRMIELPSPLMDLGSGPGMPGIPLKIAYPEVAIQLAESRQTRNRFLREACDILGLEGIEVVGSGISPKYERPVAGVITRAVEPIAKTLERISGCLCQDGIAIFMKGPHCDEEVRDAETCGAGAFCLELDRAYEIPNTSHRRRLVVFRRISRPLAKIRAEAEDLHPTRDIESEQNSLFKGLKKLLSGRGVKKEGKTLVAGTRPVSELLRDFPDQCLAWISRGNDAPPPVSAPTRLEWYRLAPELFSRLDQTGTHEPLLLTRVPDIRAWVPAEGFPAGCTLLIAFQDPENVGTVIRSAAAFGVRQVIVLQEAAHPFHPKAVRASGGAVFRIAIRSGPALADIPESLSVLPLSVEGRPLNQVKFPGSFGLLPGLEGPGLPGHWRAKAVAIPIGAGVESLNAATATAIALYQWRTRMDLSGE